MRQTLDTILGGAKGASNDWRMWDGTAMGYEGFLSDNYYTLLALSLRNGP
jgi:hypothetical protein